MKAFERWWLKYYKVCLIAGIVFIVIQGITKGFAGITVRDAVFYFAVVTSPIGALIGQVLVWLFKLLKLFYEIFVEYLKLRKQSR